MQRQGPTAVVMTEEEQRVRCAWLYFVANLNQSDIAEHIGVTRARVNRLVAEAREMGLVTVTVHHETAHDLHMGAEIAQRWGLNMCVVTPATGSSRQCTAVGTEQQDKQRAIARRAVGIAAARFLSQQLERLDAPIIGVGWGRTLEQVALHLVGVRNTSARFVSMMGSLHRNSAANAFEVVQTLAARTGGEGYYLPVPFIADTTEDRAVFMSQRVVQDTIAMARKANVVLTSLGELRNHSLVVHQAMLNSAELESLRVSGAVGDMLGSFFGTDGLPVQNELNHRTACLELDVLADVPIVLLCGGHEKLEALQALLDARRIHGLIIDGDSAHMLMQKGA